MSQELLQDNTIRVTETTLIDFTFAVAELGNRGFVPTLVNGSHPESVGIGYYTCIMTPINSYRIGLDGKEYNKPNTKEVTTEAKSDGFEKEATDLAETKETPKTVPKTTRTTKK